MINLQYRRFSDVFKRYRNGTLVENGLISLFLRNFSTILSMSLRDTFWIHFQPMFHFYNSWCFQGVQTWNIGWKWVNITLFLWNSSTILPTCYFRWINSTDEISLVITWLSEICLTLIALFWNSHCFEISCCCFLILKTFECQL